MQLGIVCGPLFAAAIASFMPNDLMKYALPGLITISLNTVLLVVTLALFNDRTLMMASHGAQQVQVGSR